MTLGLRERAVGGSVHPSRLGPMAGWYDLDYFRSQGYTDYTLVTSWPDISGKGNHLGVGAAPAYRTANWNLIQNACVNITTISGNIGTLASGGTTLTASVNSPNYYNLPCIKIIPNANAVTCGIYNLPYAQVTPGQTYTGMAACYGTDARQFFVRIEWHDSGGTQLSTTSSSNITLTSTAWTGGAITGVAPAGATQARVNCYTVSTSGVLTTDTYYMAGLGIGLGTIPANNYLPPGNVEGVQFASTKNMLRSGVSGLQYPLSLAWTGAMYGYAPSALVVFGCNYAVGLFTSGNSQITGNMGASTWNGKSSINSNQSGTGNYYTQTGMMDPSGLELSAINGKPGVSGGVVAPTSVNTAITMGNGGLNNALITQAAIMWTNKMDLHRSRQAAVFMAQKYGGPLATR